MLKIFWYILSCLAIVLILLNNPKSTNVTSFNVYSKLLGSTYASRIFLQKLTIFIVFLFFIFTIIFSIS
uniref:Probable protein-export membrane protein SecG n=1 Tax=Spyridia filamentosa TaxID=196632 RepID=A0A1Z1MKE8_SPYFI|nr:preprotein-translocase subunit g [Spyridia filamentosa]ARW66231.1 preprotein-translocase subunit g [Spyridia filamentosa]